jgi:hypothetical protein
MSNFFDTGNGFQMTFANGWTVSVQWNKGNYCDGGHAGEFGDSGRKSANAEIAAWDAQDRWHNFGHDTVDGWQSTDDVAAFIARIVAMPAS